MKIFLPLSAALFLGMAPLALAQGTDSNDAPPSNLPVEQADKPDTAAFIRQTAAASAFEVRAAALALSKAEGADVKAYAEAVMDDHMKAAKDLNETLDRLEATAPVGSASSDDPTDTERLAILGDVEGPEFDARYISMEIEAQKRAAALLTAYSLNGDDPALKEFAKRMLDRLAAHERAVTALAAARQ